MATGKAELLGGMRAAKKPREVLDYDPAFLQACE